MMTKMEKTVQINVIMGLKLNVFKWIDFTQLEWEKKGGRMCIKIPRLNDHVRSG